jgi:hypothetical protein
MHYFCPHGTRNSRFESRKTFTPTGYARRRSRNMSQILGGVQIMTGVTSFRFMLPAVLLMILPPGFSRAQVGMHTSHAATIERKVLFEEFTGEWCSLCPGGSIDMERALAAFPGKVVPVCYHDNDPLEVQQLNGMLDSIPFDPLYPGGTIDRVPYSINNPKHKMAVDRRDFLSTLATAAVRPAHVSISASVTVDRATRTLSVESRTEFSASDTGDFRVQCVVTEQAVRRDNVQLNAYDKDSVSYPSLFGAGNPLRTWRHDHVARAMLGGAVGTAGVIPRIPVPGLGYSRVYTYTVPAQFDLDQLGVVLFVSRYDRGSLTGNEVLNAEGYLQSAITDVQSCVSIAGPELDLFPNPTDGIVLLRPAGPRHRSWTVEMSDLLGRPMVALQAQSTGDVTQLDARALPPGAYLIRIRTGHEVMSRILLKR